MLRRKARCRLSKPWRQPLPHRSAPATWPVWRLPSSAADSLGIWANQFDVVLADLAIAKAERNQQNFPVINRFRYDLQDPNRPGHRVYVVGTPKTSDVKAMMVGIRNEADGKGPICAEVWVNELRLVDFDESTGWAANARATIKLADFANISLSGSIKTPGFGALEQKINNRSRETTKSIDVAGNFNMGKFFPKNWGLQLPLYLSYGERGHVLLEVVVEADGRVTYTRWDYNARGQNYPHPVFSMRPDCT